MANYRVGDFIRLSRKASGMSQEELAFQADVATETISRIENGRHKITPMVYRKIMSVLDNFPQQFYGVCSSKEVEIIDEKQMEDDAEVKFEFQKAREYLEILKEKVDNTLINEQYILRTEAIIEYYTSEITVEQMISKLEEALELTVDKYEEIFTFEDGNIECYPFTEQEALVLMNIADAYAMIKEYEKDIKIKQCILKSLDAGYVNGKSILSLKLVIKRNLALSFMLQKKYEEALTILEDVAFESKKEENGVVLAVVLSDIAWNMRMINKKRNENLYDLNEIKKIMRQAYYIAAARQDCHVQNKIKKAYSINFNEDIEISVE